MRSFKVNFFDQCNTYILLWLIWKIQAMIITSSIVSIALYLPFFLMTVYYVFKVFGSGRSKGGMKALCVFVGVLIIYGIILVLVDNAAGQDRKSFLMMVFDSLGPVFAFYTFTQRGLLNEIKIRGWVLVFVIMAVMQYYYNSQRALALAWENGSRLDEVTNNMAYLFVGLFPTVFVFRKKPILQYLYLMFLLYFIIMGYKRGAILTGAVLLIWFIYVSLQTSSRAKKWTYMFLTLIIVAIGYRYVIQLYENSEYFQIRVEQTQAGNSSERDDTYDKLLTHYINNDKFAQLVFGEGAYHTENILGLKAHNDWLELLIDCGLFGVLLYFIYFISFIKDLLISKRNPLLYAMTGACFFLTFVRSFFSMSFCDLPFYTSVIMGYCFAQVNNESSFNNINSAL